MRDYNSGEVLLLAFPFSDGTSSKRRPVLVLVDTGDETMTGGRLKRVAPYLSGEKVFCMTYGDGVSDVNITELITFHQRHGLKATLTATLPPGRFGALDIQGHHVAGFKEFRGFFHCHLHLLFRWKFFHTGHTCIL